MIWMRETSSAIPVEGSPCTQGNEVDRAKQLLLDHRWVPPASASTRLKAHLLHLEYAAYWLMLYQEGRLRRARETVKGAIAASSNARIGRIG
jgi:hypothetical protein